MKPRSPALEAESLPSGATENPIEQQRSLRCGLQPAAEAFVSCRLPHGMRDILCQNVNKLHPFNHNVSSDGFGSRTFLSERNVALVYVSSGISS